MGISFSLFRSFSRGFLPNKFCACVSFRAASPPLKSESSP